MAIESINPATGETLKTYAETSRAEVDDIIGKTHEAFLAWRRTSFEERSRRMRGAARILRRNAEAYARLMAQEMGKPIAEAEAEIEKCAWNCDFYAEHAASFLADEPVATNARESFVAFEPLGPVRAIMPWNFPFWQVFRFAAPALMAGNTAVLKHASNVPQCALAIERVFQHEIGITSAELEHALLQHCGGLARHFAPRWTAPGKGDGAYERVLDDRLDLPAADHQRSK